MGNLVFQATLGGQVNLVGPNTASTFNLNVPAVSATLATTAANTFTAVQTLTAGSASAPALTTTGDTNTGIFFPAADTIAFAEGGTEAMRLDSAGNMGLGVTPSAWSSGIKAAQIGLGACVFGSTSSYNNTNVTANMFYNSGGSPIYQGSDFASFYQQVSGSHRWFNAPSGTAGNAISFTQAMTLDASGNLGVGTTSPTQKITANGSIRLTGNSSNFNETGAQMDSYDGLRLASYISTGSAIQFLTNASGGNTAERARIDSSGNLLVGTTSNLGRLSVVGSGTTGGTFSCSIYNSGAALTLLQTRDDGFVFLPSTAGKTTGSAANLYIDSGNGAVYRSTSSLKYKQNVQNAVHGLAEVMQLRAVTYEGKSETDAGKTFGGLIAEEVHAAGLTEFVQYAEDGTPDALAYGNMVSLCIKAIQELKAELDAAKARIATLEA